MPSLAPGDRLLALVWHDDDVDVHVNGQPLFRSVGYRTFHFGFPLSPLQRFLFHPGDNTITVHCKNGVGPQVLDLGFKLVRASGEGHAGRRGAAR
jgi:hypothetical protein